MKEDFFPPNVLDVSPRTDEFKRKWCTDFLKAMNEPALNQLGADRDEAYRFLWLRTFHRPIAVRLDRQGDKRMLVVKELDGKGGYEPGVISKDVSRPIAIRQWNRFVSLTEDAGFWEMATDQMGLVVDGALWLLEGYRDAEWHAVNRACPSADGQDAAFREACLYLLALSGLEVPAPQVY